MQYDLFHAYTVDAHTLFVLSKPPTVVAHEIPITNRRSCPRSCSSLPTRDRLSRRPVPRHREGPRRDHSQLVRWTRKRSVEQGLSRYDARLVAWLVQNHLELSLTARSRTSPIRSRQRVSAAKVGDETHLDYLYVADSADAARHESQAVNSWKASLFQEFYEV